MKLRLYVLVVHRGLTFMAMNIIHECMGCVVNHSFHTWPQRCSRNPADTQTSGNIHRLLYRYSDPWMMDSQILSRQYYHSLDSVELGHPFNWVFKLQRNALDSTWDLQVVLLWGRCWHWYGVPCGIIDSLSMSILCCQYLCRIAEICIFKSLVLPVLLKGWNLQLEELDSCLCSEVPMKNHGIPLEQLYVTPVITCEMDSKLTTCTVHECHLWQYGKVACHVTKRIPSWRPLDKLLLSEIINLCIALKELILNVWRCAPQCGCLIDFRQKMLCIYDKFDIYSAADNLFS